MASNSLNLLESKLGRCLRFLKRHTDDAAQLLGQRTEALTDNAAVAAQIAVLCAGLSDEIDSLQKISDQYEVEVLQIEGGSPADKLKLVDDTAEALFEAKKLQRRLIAHRTNVEHSFRNYDQLSRSVSRATLRSFDPYEPAADAAGNDAETREQSPSVNSAATADRDEDDQQQQFGSTQTEQTPGTSEFANSSQNQNGGNPHVSGVTSGQNTSDATIQMLCQAVMQLTSAQQGNSQPHVTSHLKLPKHNLPKFTKDPEKGPSFWDQFEKAVDQHPTLGKVEKLQYLKGCLDGDAAKLVATLPLENKNYDLAVSALKNRFDNPNVAIERIYSKLLDLPTVPPRDCKKLRDFFFDLENSLQQLEVLGADSKSDHLVGVLLRKLPRYLISHLERAKGPRQQWSMQLLRALLADELEIAEATHMRDDRKEPDEKPKTDRNGTGTGKSKNGGRSTADGFAGHERKTGSGKPGDHSRQDRKPKCFFCGGEHWSGECQKYRTADKRREIVKNARSCFICFDSRHAARDCRSDKPCFHCRKVKMHHSSLCPDKFSDAARSRESARKSDDTEDLTQQDIGGLASDEHAVMKTAICSVVNPDDESQCVEDARIFMDSGTSRTWMTLNRAKQLKLKLSRKKRLLVNRFADDGQPKSIEMQEAKVILKTRTGQRIKIAVAVTPKTLGAVTLAAKSEVKRHIPINLKLADEIPSRDTKVEIDIMIGNDYYDDLVYYDRVCLLPGLRLISSAFGWVLSGRMSNKSEGKSFETGMALLPFTETSFPELPDDADIREAIRSNNVKMDNLWSLEALGIKDEPNDITDDVAIQKFNNTVKFENGRYMVTWPYTQNVGSLPQNDDIAAQRLRSMIARSQKQKQFEYLEKYDAVIRDQLETGVIEEVLPAEIDGPNRVHYLAHHGVEKPDRTTTKLRIVYNASYRRNPDAPSLNDCLYRGQVFIENLVILLIRFRMNPVAVVGDLEKALLRVGLQQTERDVTRFFWVRDIQKPATNDNLVTYRFTRVSFGVKSSPFLLGATVAYHLKQQNSDVARQIERDLYVDNLITGVSNAEDAKRLYLNSKQIFASANMNIREFASNDQVFNDSIPDADAAARSSVKVLGMEWDTEADTLSPRPCENHDVSIWSKKKILSVLFQVYDPLGLVSPVTLPGKALLQKLNKRNFHWDEKLPPEIEAEWQSILTCLDQISSVKVYRFLRFSLPECDRMMVFCDASGDAYAAIVYLQNTTQPVTQSHLIFAKARVRPLKGMTIPRLELMAVVLGVRMIKFLRQFLPYNGKVVLWSDSQCVLRWICDQSITGVFNRNRLNEIRKAEKVNFRYVPSKENPADIASRGCSVDQLTDFWWNGPDFCRKPESEWPTWEGNLESLPNPITTETEDEMFAVQEVDESSGPFGIDVHKFSSFRRLIRVTAHCQRFIDAAKQQERHRSTILTAVELKAAANLWIKFVQSTGFAALFEDMKKGRKNSTTLQLGVKPDDDGILRCHGRLAMMTAVNDTKFPILLPKRSRLTELIIEDCHARSMHAGTNQTLAAVKTEFWIPHGRARVRAFVKKCQTCRYFEGKQFARPPMPELPEARVTRDRPFRHVGLDYFGPLFTKNEGIEQKRWVCLITCLATRAVHLEMVNDLSADEFLMALRRFMGRRGKCVSVVSDNATQFKAVHKSNVINETLAGQVITWKFIPEMAPWAGGVYERLVRTVKSAMKKSLRKSLLSDMQLTTMLVEVENCVNSRPLTYLADDIDSWCVITPNDLLGVEAQQTLSPDGSEDRAFRSGPESAREKMVSLYKAQLNQLDAVWNVWQNDYLLSLREKMHYGHKDSHGAIRRAPQVGEIVVVKDEKLNRGKWKIAKINDIIISTDGNVCAAKVKMSNGHILIRPVNFLTPLELEIDDIMEPVNHDSERVNTPTSASPRPKRHAATEAKEKIRAMIHGETEYSSDNEVTD